MRILDLLSPLRRGTAAERQGVAHKPCRFDFLCKAPRGKKDALTLFVNLDFLA